MYKLIDRYCRGNQTGSPRWYRYRLNGRASSIGIVLHDRLIIVIIIMMMMIMMTTKMMMMTKTTTNIFNVFFNIWSILLKKPYPVHLCLEILNLESILNEFTEPCFNISISIQHFTVPFSSFLPVCYGKFTQSLPSTTAPSRKEEKLGAKKSLEIFDQETCQYLNFLGENHCYDGGVKRGYLFEHIICSDKFIKLLVCT